MALARQFWVRRTTKKIYEYAYLRTALILWIVAVIIVIAWMLL